MIAELVVVVEGGRVVRLSAAPPLAAKVLTGPHGPELLLVGAAASLLEGDRLRISLRLGIGARLTVQTAAATLAHPCPAGGFTSFDVDADLEADARLAWLPEPLVACEGCNHVGRARLRLARGAAVVWSESVALGRSGERPGSVELRLDAELERAPLLREGLRVGSAAPGWSGPSVLDGAGHVGTIALLGTRPESAGVLQLAGPGGVFRVVGANGVDVERSLFPIREAFLATLLGTQPALVP